MILIIALLVRPVVALVYVLSFRKVIANALKSADKAEVGPHGLKWHKATQQEETAVNRALASAGDDAQQDSR